MLENNINIENKQEATKLVVIRSPQKKLLLENAEELIKDIQDGKSYRFLSAKWKVHQEVIHWFIHLSEHCARAKQAQLLSSYELIEQAVQAIDAIKADDTPATVRKQVEKMNLCLFIAKSKNRKEFDFSYKENLENDKDKIIVIPSNEALELLDNKENKFVINNE
jgi:hypothetical protein